MIPTRFLLALLAALAPVVAADSTYQHPPKDVEAALNAPPTPLASVSPKRDYVLLLQGVRYPPLSEVAQPMLRLAGIRIDVNTNAMHLAPYYVSATLKRLSNGSEIPLALPKEAKISAPAWSPDGTRFAFTNTTAHGLELWIATTATGAAHTIPGVSLNGVRMGFGGGGRAGAVPAGPIEWLADNRTAIVRLIPANRGAAPVEGAVPEGPRTEESLGHATPAPTFEDLLSNSHDEDLFDYYATAQLAALDMQSGKTTPLAKPGIFTMVRPSPDGKHLLAVHIHKPYSYQLPATSFPAEVEIWDRTGKLERSITSLPLANRVPIGGVRTGPRSYQWLPDKPATLAWVEALDGGDPHKKADYRDRIVALAAPFQGDPAELARVEQRFRSLQPLAGGKALVDDYNRDTRVIRTMLVDIEHAGTPARTLFSRNERDAYHDPGRLVLKTSATGERIAIQQGDDVLLSGDGASPQGEHPFLDRFNLATGKSQRVFQAEGAGYEDIVAVLDDSGSRLLTRRESLTDPPNYFLRTNGESKALTAYADPMPQAAGVKKELVKYKRADGVPLSFTLILPANYKSGQKLPALLWAYPYEFSDADTAGQVTGHDAQSFPLLNYHQLGVLHGYAIIDNAAMPIIGDPDTVNNTYVDQLLMDARAAVDKAAEMGVVDRERVGVFGHSYGAFMTANLVAHSDLFHAAVAESGAYNRTLTPFGFQAERRTFWEAPDVYTKMSPFWSAQKIKTPLLLIHGEADDNTGTFPIQSERMYAAVRGNGGTVRLVMLPAEAHGYRGLESMEHVLFEELSWFDKYLR
jgi:dipeptidyl aminopeptidase/acylaminoacyl peptidase